MDADIELDDWQKEVLEHKGHFLLCTGRQVGKTTIMARKAAEYMTKNKNSKIIIVSLTEDQAKLIIVMILDYLQRNYKSYLKVKAKDRPTQNRITLNNGAVALARPVGNTGDAVRGFTGDVLIIDEASRMPELAFTAAKPTLASTGGELWICSTPFGKEGYFWECFKNESNRFKVFHVSTEEVYTNRKIAGRWTEHRRTEALNFLAGEQKDMSRLQYGQEYLGLFMDDINRLFSDDIIQQSCILPQPKSIVHKRDHFLGVDVARLGGDETTFEIIAKINEDYYEHVYNLTQQYTLLTTTADKIVGLHEVYNFPRDGIGIDTTGVGAGVFDMLLREEKVRRSIVSIENAKRSLRHDVDNPKVKGLLKTDMYMNMLSMLEKGQLKLLDDEKVRLSLQSVQYEYDKDTHGLTKLKIYGTYTHIVEGLVRACWLAKEKRLNIWITSF